MSKNELTGSELGAYIARQLAMVQFLRDQDDHCRTDEPIVFVQGTPGIGKTMIIRAAAEKAGYHCLTVIGAAKSPEDVGGIPVVDFKKLEVRTATPDVVADVRRARETTGKPVVLFLDEATRIPEQSQAAWMSFLQFRTIHGHALPEDTVIMLAGNAEEDDRGVSGLLAPVVNRVRMVTLKADPKDWANSYASERGLHPLVTATVANFPSGQNGGTAFNYIPASNAAPFGSPRSWEAVSNTLRFAEHLANTGGLPSGNSNTSWLDDPLLQTDIVATIGPNCAAALLANAKYYTQLIPAADVLKDPATVPMHDQPTLACMQFLTLAAAVRAIEDVNGAISYVTRSTNGSAVPKWTPLLPMMGKALAQACNRVGLAKAAPLFNAKLCKFVPFYQKYVKTDAADVKELFA